MKLKPEKLLTAGFAAALGASFIATTPVEARGWVKFGEVTAGNYYIRDMKCRGPICEYKFMINDGNGYDTAIQINCNSWKYRHLIVTGEKKGQWQDQWETMSPRNIVSSVAESYCR